MIGIPLCQVQDFNRRDAMKTTVADVVGRSTRLLSTNLLRACPINPFRDAIFADRTHGKTLDACMTLWAIHAFSALLSKSRLSHHVRPSKSVRTVLEIGQSGRSASVG
ncbi:MAG: hypothetical protein ABIQ70_12295 [Dokdonella sp.]